MIGPIAHSRHMKYASKDVPKKTLKAHEASAFRREREKGHNQFDQSDV